MLTPVRFSLCWLVKNQEVDLLVVGSRGLKGLRRAIFKSIRCVSRLKHKPVKITKSHRRRNHELSLINTLTQKIEIDFKI